MLLIEGIQIFISGPFRFDHQDELILLLSYIQ